MVIGEATRYFVHYYDPEIVRRLGPTWEWVELTGWHGDRHASEGFDTEREAEAVFLTSGKRGFDYRIVKRTHREEVVKNTRG